jgi:hypothetical protein
LTWTELDVVDYGTYWDVLKRKAVTNLRKRVATTHQLSAYLQTVRSEDVALLTVCIEEQSDTSGAVWIVLDGLNDCRYAILVTLEIDNTVSLLVTATDITHGETALVVTTTGLELTDSERLLRRTCCDLFESADSLASLARSCGLKFSYCHFVFSIFSRREYNF